MSTSQDTAGGAEGSEPEVVRDDDAGRFEVLVDGEVQGFAEYEREGTVLRFTHTVVKPQTERRGLGTLLVTAALDAARAEGAQVLPQCSFVRAYLARHPDDLDLVPADQREAFGLPVAEQ